jgi:hypothetical protein
MGPKLRRECACGREYDASHWSTLALATRLGSQELAPLVTSWPARVVVEVRTCTGCGRSMSALMGSNTTDFAPRAEQR